MQVKVKCEYSMILINPKKAGGGGRNPPPRRFAR